MNRNTEWVKMYRCLLKASLTICCHFFQIFLTSSAKKTSSIYLPETLLLQSWSYFALFLSSINISESYSCPRRLNAFAKSIEYVNLRSPPRLILAKNLFLLFLHFLCVQGQFDFVISLAV